MNAILLIAGAITLSALGIGMLAATGWADYIVTRDEHRKSQKGEDHDHV